MASSYELISSRSSRQVLSPTTVIDAEVCTIQTKPTGIIADFWVNADTFNADGAAAQLTAFADNIEQIISLGHAVGGTGTSYLDANGLQAVFVTFTVAYKSPNPLAADITTDVDVPVGLLGETDPAINRALFGKAVALIDAAYSHLTSAAGVTTQTPTAPTQTPQTPSAGTTSSG